VEFDVILSGGRVLDGTGTPATTADVGIRDERIEAVGDLSAAVAAEVVDVTGRYVAPGFVDVHAHTDVAYLLSDTHLDVKTAGIRQGVTTEVCGNCGATPFPVRLDGDDPYLGLFPEEAQRTWHTVADYRKTMAETPLVANLAPLLGHGTLRAAVMGHADCAPTAEELRDMQRIVEQAMDDGAFGFSSGLIYAPGVFSETEELVALAVIAGRHGRPYTTHMRDEADHLEEAVAEALRIGREADTSVQISHHKAAGRRNWGKSDRTLRAVADARAFGLDVTVDVYPYTAGSTLLGALLPPWVLEGGNKATLQRLADRESREQIKRDYVEGIEGWQNFIELSGWASVVLAGEPPLAGRSVEEIAADAGRDPVDCVADILLDNPGTIIVIHMMDEGEVRQIADAPFAMIGSDGIPVPGQQHPRLAGTFARVLNQAARDETRLADLVRRMTSLPAQRFNLPDRGVVATGKAADLVVFDAAAVDDNASYEQPLLAPSGIDHVLLAGRLVVRDAAVTDVRAGRVLEPA
jgi:N-acyl-D-amino-acid deacylase